MSFHPLMVYDERFQQVGAQAARRRAAVHLHAGAPRRARRDADEVSAGPEALGGAGGALSGAGAAGLPHRQRHAPRRADPRHDAGRSRGRRDLLRDVLQGAGRQVRAAGLPHAVVRAGSAPSASPKRSPRSSGIKVGETDAVGHVHAARVRVPRRLRPRADRDGQQRALARARATRRCRRGWWTTSGAKGERGASAAVI